MGQFRCQWQRNRKDKGYNSLDRFVIVDRDRDLFRVCSALKEARAGDIVILAGKGHETYQVLKDRVIHFDDREVARDVLRELGYQK